MANWIQDLGRAASAVFRPRPSTPAAEPTSRLLELDNFLGSSSDKQRALAQLQSALWPSVSTEALFASPGRPSRLWDPGQLSGLRLPDSKVDESEVARLINLGSEAFLSTHDRRVFAQRVRSGEDGLEQELAERNLLAVLRQNSPVQRPSVDAWRLIEAAIQRTHPGNAGEDLLRQLKLGNAQLSQLPLGLPHEEVLELLQRVELGLTAPERAQRELELRTVASKVPTEFKRPSPEAAATVPHAVRTMEQAAETVGAPAEVTQLWRELLEAAPEGERAAALGWIFDQLHYNGALVRQLDPGVSPSVLRSALGDSGLASRVPKDFVDTVLATRNAEVILATLELFRQAHRNPAAPLASLSPERVGAALKMDPVVPADAQTVRRSTTLRPLLAELQLLQTRLEGSHPELAGYYRRSAEQVESQLKA